MINLQKLSVNYCPKKCGFEYSSPHDLIEHLKVHSLPHRQWQSFDYWIRKKYYLWDVVDISEYRTERNHIDWKWAMKNTCFNQKCFLCLTLQFSRTLEWRNNPKNKHKSSAGKDIGMIKSKRILKSGLCTEICMHISIFNNMGEKIKPVRCRMKCMGNHINSDIHWHTHGATNNYVHVWRTSD
jgi:hypothetical protein